jgi:hypothetical protein
MKERRCTALAKPMERFLQLLLYKKFPSLSFDDNQAAFDERKRLIVTPKKRRRDDGVGSQQEGRD